MKTDELREKYLSFFESKGCVRRPSDVLVPRDDPTVLFTPAGMNQFKNQFLGVGKLEFTRATTCQKCLRTGDIQNVGVTAYHHTFFEMLGNFSFGDYFKKEAISWAWEFLTDKKWLGLDPDRLTVSVYLDDEEAYRIWQNDIGLAAERIRRDDEHENFWPAGAPSEGPDGVCGPCSEIFYHPPGGGKEVEIWNLVFTQFNRVGPPPNNLRPLPKKNIDTGMGLERTAAVLQGVESNFEIDILRPLCAAAGEAVGVKYEFAAKHGRPLRRIADHVRAVTFCIHEGVEPDSEKQGYVVRQLLRRAALEGWLLGRHDPFLFQLVPVVVELMKTPYPELAKTVDAVANSIREEEKQFLTTVERGVPRFEQLAKKTRDAGSKMISGEDAFDLQQTHGFFLELTEALAARDGLEVDREGFDACRRRHEEISGRGAFVDAVMAEGPLDELRKRTGGTEFLGYDTTEADAKLVGIISAKKLVEKFDQPKSKDPIGIVLDRTPFYGEAGGQVGDTGRIDGENFAFRVLDAQRDGELLIHIGRLERGRVAVGEAVHAGIDAVRRAGIRRAHSATHILHHALHKVVGETATQRGSKVENDALRFDFAHNRALSDEEVRRVEDVINDRIAAGAAVMTRLMELDDARQAGAMALFGEKYPDRVRVVSMGDFSIELCGGTHLTNTGQVGFCKITSEEPVAKGVRRITALTGQKALERMRESEQLLKRLAGMLKVPQPEDLPRRIETLQEELRQAKRELAEQTTKSVAGTVDEVLESAESAGGATIVAHALEGAKRETLRGFIDQVRARVKGPVAILVGTVEDGKVALTA
ncbi:MAG: alanine--tRNA ligase, partial [Planctomycetes bacterium]|nr:alanine--tRNA ligase [Planctomycetota bacterium]